MYVLYPTQDLVQEILDVLVAQPLPTTDTKQTQNRHKTQMGEREENTDGREGGKERKGWRHLREFREKKRESKKKKKRGSQKKKKKRRGWWWEA